MMKKFRYRWSSIAIILIVHLLLVGLSVLPAGAGAVEQQGIVDKARITFQIFMQDENMVWLRDKLPNAKGLLIVPGLLKGGFIIGGSGGSGVLIVRDEKTGQWSQPGFYTMGSVSFGLQIGGEAADVIMMVRTRRALEKLYSSSIKLGGDTSIAAGPVGVGAKSNITADIVSFALAKGAYAGLSFEGAIIAIRDKWNKAYYGMAVRPIDIFVKRSVSNPGSAELRKTVAGFERKGKRRTTYQAEARHHIVQRGDTLYKISRKYGVTVADLRRLNHLSKGQDIYPGQKILIDPAAQK
ncbi:MAG: LysM peptidoglycan-binding domain-containing protein [Deltaproteobacteria bacterium]|nr:LysM peptidoglycan-binding domain-containing protein [Deltaproteobacteria bacterium]